MVSNHSYSQMRNYSPLRKQRTLKMIASSHPQFHLSKKNFDMSAVYKSRSQSWLGRLISSIGRTPLIFVPAGVKIDTQTYRERILEQVIQDLSKTMFSGKPFVFQQDGAPAHTSNATQAWLRSNNPDFIKKEEWPPYSPDLNPMDYSIWSIWKRGHVRSLTPM